MDPRSWKDDPLRKALLALYAEVDAALSPWTCGASAECCNFANTGREPYPTAVELAEVKHAIRASGVTIGAAGKKKHLTVVGGAAEGRSAGTGARRDDRTCPMLSEQGRCLIYASRPFGCRTFFCARIEGPGKLPRAELQRYGRAIADLAARYAPHDPHPRPLLRALAKGRQMP